MNKPSKSFDTKLILHGLITLALIVNVGLLFYSSDRTAADAADELKIVLLTTPECEDCFDLQPLRDYIIEGGAEESNITEIEYTSSKGEKLLKKYNITKVPTALLMGNYSDYDYLQELVGTAGEIVEDALLITKLQPPYLDLEQDRLRGLFEVTYITDETCEECYDIEEHRVILERLVLKPSSERYIDVSSEEGILLLEEYDILAVPTLVFRGDLLVYERLIEIWQEVGSIEDDGAWVLREGVGSMGTYKQLPEGSIIVPEDNPPEEAV